ncbi:hypothetical protein GOEFS_035_00930 [Gordonia effusa NBRC 100432]|uniref:DUF350 domain-containing protein n=1 Tax=Gordonia effusa NBRC 100432 TaxID=1077974 RepID=H0QXL0_9ACTN|nr:DUF350 domain-containing protein [Gordonia effusa]GAB17561.1 hypothetical protein GOEFS_035_00930 [Gordonia effusa NBRC 100432]
MLTRIIENSYAAAAYSASGIALMVASFAVVDLLTPGNLRHQLWFDRNRNAGILVGSNLAAIALIIVAAITASEGRLGEGLLYTVIYTAIGIVLMAITFLLIDLVTPGKLGELLVDVNPHPAVWVQAVAHIGIALIISASIL